MLRLLLWIVVLALLWTVANGDLSVPGIPREGIVYASAPPAGACGSTGCTTVYALELANIGRSMQDTVRVRLRTEAVATAVVPPTLRRETEAVPATRTTEHGGVDVYEIAHVAPGDRVTLTFVLRSPSREAAPEWGRLLVGVDPALGSAQPGDPAAITAARVLHAAARAIHRAVRAVSSDRA